MDILKKGFNRTGVQPTVVQIGELSRQYVIVNGSLEHIQKLQTDWEAYKLAPADFPLYEGKETSRTVEKLAHAYLTTQQGRLEEEKAKEEATKAEKAKKKKEATEAPSTEPPTLTDKPSDKSRSPSIEKKKILIRDYPLVAGFSQDVFWKTIT